MFSKSVVLFNADLQNICVHYKEVIMCDDSKIRESISFFLWSNGVPSDWESKLRGFLTQKGSDNRICLIEICWLCRKTDRHVPLCVVCPNGIYVYGYDTQPLSLERDTELMKKIWDGMHWSVSMLLQIRKLTHVPSDWFIKYHELTPLCAESSAPLAKSAVSA